MGEHIKNDIKNILEANPIVVKAGELLALIVITAGIKWGVEGTLDHAVPFWRLFVLLWCAQLYVSISIFEGVVVRWAMPRKEVN
tara:strand:- start:191 stop:442 length:252 start_codon:yes stop_codon:yes gene_type:complete